MTLNARSCRTCAHRTFLDHVGQSGSVPVPVTATTRVRMEEGREFEDDVMTSVFVTAGTRLADVRGSRDPAVTVDAMQSGAPIIAGGVLPPDNAGRVGVPDLMYRVGGGYVPVDVKNHRVAEPSGRYPLLSSSLLGSPAMPGGVFERGRDIAGDLMQLAHYTRMLEACGFHSGAGHVGGLVGSDGPDRVVWYDLDAPFRFPEFTEDPAGGSVMETYDARHHVRFSASSGAAVTSPVGTGGMSGCASCEWVNVCRSAVPAGDVSFALTRDSVHPRDWELLRTLGFGTVNDLARFDMADSDLVSRFVSGSSGPREAKRKLVTLVDAAGMLAAGVAVKRTSQGPLHVPSADVEVDIDYEWDVANRVYLWGGRVRRGDGTGVTVEQFAHFGRLSGDDEAQLASEFVTWLRDVISDAESDGLTVAVFHYSHAERTHLRRVLGEGAISDVVDHFVDLLPFVRANFTTPYGLGVKHVASGFGFRWRDSDPGGAQSQDWFEDALTAGDVDEADRLRARILEYNEDDMAATAAVRDGMAAHAGGAAAAA